MILVLRNPGVKAREEGGKRILYPYQNSTLTSPRLSLYRLAAPTSSVTSLPPPLGASICAATRSPRARSRDTLAVGTRSASPPETFKSNEHKTRPDARVDHVREAFGEPRTTLFASACSAHAGSLTDPRRGPWPRARSDPS